MSGRCQQQVGQTRWLSHGKNCGQQHPNSRMGSAQCPAWLLVAKQKVHVARDLKKSRKAAEEQGVEEMGYQGDPPHAGPEASRAVDRGQKQSVDVTGAGLSFLVVGHVRKKCVHGISVGNLIGGIMELGQ